MVAQALSSGACKWSPQRGSWNGSQLAQRSSGRRYERSAMCYRLQPALADAGSGTFGPESLFTRFFIAAFITWLAGASQVLRRHSWQVSRKGLSMA